MNERKEGKQLSALQAAVQSLLESCGMLPRRRGRPVPIEKRLAELKAVWRESIGGNEADQLLALAGAQQLSAAVALGASGETEGGEA